MTTAPMESRALMETLAAVDPAAQTACADWTVHDLVAHLAAGAKEIADLIEESLAKRPARATQSFDEREAAFRALPDEQLRRAMVDESRRKVAATKALHAGGPEATFDFTGRPFTAATLEMHGRSEAAIHRWDLVGDDVESAVLLAQPELTRHAVEVLNTLPILAEAPTARTSQAHASELRIVLRSPARPDVVLTAAPRRFTLRARRTRLGQRRRRGHHRRSEPAPEHLGAPIEPASHHHPGRSVAVGSSRRGALAARDPLAP